MNVQDFVEVLTRCALEEAGWIVSAWDERPDEFLFDIDLLCRHPRPLLVLVNNSDSFFASQKKFWRNVEEPFESAIAFGTRSLVANVSFLTDVARLGPLYRMAQQFFDRTFCVTFVDSGDERLVALTALARPIRSAKKESIELVRAQVGESSAVEVIYRDLIQFFEHLHAAQPEADIPRDDRLYRRFPPRNIHFGENIRLRRQCSALLVLGLDLVKWMRGYWSPGASSLIIRPSTSADKRYLERLSRLASLHKFAEVDRLIGGCVVKEVAAEVRELLSLTDESLERLSTVSGRMVQARPTIRDYVQGASDYEGARSMALHATSLLENPTVELIARELLRCSNEESYAGVTSDRNWLLELLLQASDRSQTYVQQRCSIHRLTHAVTGEILLTATTAREIAEVLMPTLAQANTGVNDLTSMFMRQRKYNLDTHSYANPLYIWIRDLLETLKPESHELLGFPSTNGAVAAAWHTDAVPDARTAGQIRVQFLVQPRDPSCDGKRCIVKVISAHDGHAADKRKELAAKGRILRLAKSSEGFEIRSDLYLALVLDGDWRHTGSSMSGSLEMVAGAGWSGIFDSGTLAELAAELRTFFQSSE